MVVTKTKGLVAEEPLEWLVAKIFALRPSDVRLPDIALRLKESAERKQNDLLRARALLLLGKHYIARHNYLEASRVLESGFEHRHFLSQVEQEQYLLLLAKTYLALYQFEPLIAQSVELLKLADEAHNPSFAIEVHSVLGALNISLGILDNALFYFDKGLELANTALIAQPAHLLYGLGRFYFAKGDSANALYYYQAALNQAIAEEDRHYEGVVLNNLGVFYSAKGDFKLAVQYYLQALKASKESDDAWMMTLECNNIGAYLLSQKRYLSAGRYFRLALKYQEKTPAASREALIKGNLAELALMMGHHDKARQLLHESLVLAEQSQDSWRIQERYEDLALFYEAIADFENALTYHKGFHKQKLQAVESSASVRSTLLQNKFELDKLRQEQEIHRLKNIELVGVVRQLELLSHQDGLTGLYNRRYFDAKFQQMVTEQQKANEVFCLMMADIDNFKKINDSFSHTIGDDVLKIVADIFMNALRRSDIVARYGGEEIVALFPETSLENAKLVCDKIRQKIEHYPWMDLRPGLSVTISVGIADNLAQAGHSILEVADAKLYQAKRNGKNRVAC